MPEKLTFTSVELDKFTRSTDGLVANFRASLTAPVMAKMGWTEIPECLTGASLDGEVTAISLELVPADKPMEKHAMSLDLAKINSFATVRLELEGKKGKGFRTELRFKVHSQDAQGARKLEIYMLVAGKSKMIISYEKQAQQDVLPGADAGEDQPTLVV